MKGFINLPSLLVHYILDSQTYKVWTIIFEVRKIWVKMMYRRWKRPRTGKSNICPWFKTSHSTHVWMLCYTNTSDSSSRLRLHVTIVKWIKLFILCTEWQCITLPIKIIKWYRICTVVYHGLTWFDVIHTGYCSVATLCAFSYQRSSLIYRTAYAIFVKWAALYTTLWNIKVSYLFRKHGK